MVFPICGRNTNYMDMQVERVRDCNDLCWTTQCSGQCIHLCSATALFATDVLALAPQVASLHVKIFHTVHGFLFAEIVFDACWVSSARTSGISYRIWFEKSPKQIVRNLSIL
jgi:hypothetical protein